MPGKPWTAEQEALLVARRSEGRSLIEIANELRLPILGVRHKASRLNAGVVPTRRGWSKVEERRLLRLYPTATWPDLSRAFPGRTHDNIQQYAARHGLRRHGIHDATSELTKIAALTETQVAYIAGLVDGEGTIILSKRGNMRVSMGLTDEPAIRFLESVVGGNVRQVPAKPRRKPFWMWVLSKERACLALLSRIRRYMIIKRDYPLR